MPSLDGFVKNDNSQAQEIETLLIVATDVSLQINHKQQVEPMLNKLSKLSKSPGKAKALLADNRSPSIFNKAKQSLSKLSQAYRLSRVVQAWTTSV